MKKLVSMLIAISLLATFAVSPSFAQELTCYTEDFSGALEWAALKNVGTNADGSAFEGAAIKTVAYGSDAQNQALMIQSGENCWTHYGEFNTWNKGISEANSVNGKSTLVFDFMPASDTLAQIETCYVTFVKEDGTTASPNGKGSDRLLTFMKNNNNGYGLRVLNSDTQWGVDYIGDVETHKWHRIQMIFDPDVGTADYILTTNIDGNGESSVYEVRNASLGISGCKGISNLKFFPYRNNGRYYFDNIVLKELSDMTLVSSTPSADDEKALVEEGISLSFSNSINSYNLKVNSADAAFDLGEDGKTLTYAGKLAYSESYTVNGSVTDVDGQAYNVNLSFTTEAKKGVSTIRDVLHKYDFDGTTNGWCRYISSVEETDGRTVLKMIGNPEGDSGSHDWVTYSEWRLWQWGNHKNIVGDLALNFDFMIDQTTPTDAFIETFILCLPGSDGSNSGTARLMMVDYNQESGKWAIRFKNSEGKFESTGIEINAGEWVNVSTVIHPDNGTYDVYTPNGIKTYDIIAESGNKKICSDLNAINDFRLLNTAVKSSYYLDNLSITNYLEIDKAYFADDNGDELKEDSAPVANPTYKAVVYNNNSKNEDFYFVMSAVNEGGKLTAVAVKPVTVAANSHIEISESFGAEADVSDCVVKAFFVRKENVKPFETDVLPLIELDYIN